MKKKNFFDLKQVNATPGQVVKAFRTNFNLTLKELENITGISESNLSAIERERLDIGVKRAVLLSAAFGIEPATLLFPPGYERPEYKSVERIRTRAARFIAKKTGK